jgi:hypothetical protein
MVTALAVDLRPLVGCWVNYDRHSTGIGRLELRDRAGALIVRGSGACDPGLLDWGESVGAAYGAGPAEHEAVGFTAVYGFRFLTVLLAGYLNQRLLVVDAYSRFTDASGRAATFQRDHLYLP